MLLNREILNSPRWPSNRENNIIVVAVHFFETNVGRVFFIVVAAYIEIRWYAQQIPVDRCGKYGNRCRRFECDGQNAAGWIPDNGLREATNATYATLYWAKVGDRERLLRCSGNWKKFKQAAKMKLLAWSYFNWWRNWCFDWKIIIEEKWIDDEVEKWMRRKKDKWNE